MFHMTGSKTSTGTATAPKGGRSSSSSGLDLDLDLHLLLPSSSPVPLAGESSNCTSTDYQTAPESEDGIEIANNSTKKIQGDSRNTTQCRTNTYILPQKSSKGAASSKHRSSPMTNVEKDISNSSKARPRHDRFSTIVEKPEVSTNSRGSNNHSLRNCPGAGALHCPVCQQIFPAIAYSDVLSLEKAVLLHVKRCSAASVRDKVGLSPPPSTLANKEVPGKVERGKNIRKSSIHADKFKVGARFLVSFRRKTVKGVRPAIITQVDLCSGAKRAKFHFTRTEPKLDEWIPVESSRIKGIDENFGSKRKRQKVVKCSEPVATNASTISPPFKTNVGENFKTNVGKDSISTNVRDEQAKTTTPWSDNTHALMQRESLESSPDGSETQVVDSSHLLAKTWWRKEPKQKVSSSNKKRARTVPTVPQFDLGSCLMAADGEKVLTEYVPNAEVEKETKPKQRESRRLQSQAKSEDELKLGCPCCQREFNTSWMDMTEESMTRHVARCHQKRKRCIDNDFFAGATQSSAKGAAVSAHNEPLSSPPQLNDSLGDSSVSELSGGSRRRSSSMTPASKRKKMLISTRRSSTENTDMRAERARSIRRLFNCSTKQALGDIILHEDHSMDGSVDASFF